LNAKKIIWCWPIWILSCFVWMYYSIYSKQWFLLSVWIGFCVANVYGWRKWYTDSSMNKLFINGKYAGDINGERRREENKKLEEEIEEKERTLKMLSFLLEEGKKGVNIIRETNKLIKGCLDEEKKDGKIFKQKLKKINKLMMKGDCKGDDPDIEDREPSDIEKNSYNPMPENMRGKKPRITASPPKKDGG